jgi:hypothetical protein
VRSVARALARPFGKRAVGALLGHERDHEVGGREQRARDPVRIAVHEHASGAHGVERARRERAPELAPAPLQHGVGVVVVHVREAVRVGGDRAPRPALHAVGRPSAREEVGRTREQLRARVARLREMTGDHARLEQPRVERQLGREAAVAVLEASERFAPLAHARIAERAHVVAHLERRAQRREIAVRGLELGHHVGARRSAHERGRAQPLERVAVRCHVGGRALGGAIESGRLHGLVV